MPKDSERFKIERNLNQRICRLHCLVCSFYVRMADYCYDTNAGSTYARARGVMVNHIHHCHPEKWAELERARKGQPDRAGAGTPPATPDEADATPAASVQAAGSPSTGEYLTREDQT